MEMPSTGSSSRSGLMDDVPSRAEPAGSQHCSVLALPFPPAGRAVPSPPQPLLGLSLPLAMERQKNPLAPSQSGGCETICWGDRCLVTLVHLLPLQFSPTLSCACTKADRTAREQTRSSPRCTGSGRAPLHQTGQTGGTSQP